jgi:hypothetical protein
VRKVLDEVRRAATKENPMPALTEALCAVGESMNAPGRRGGENLPSPAS